MNIGKRIKERRKEIGLSVEEVSEKLNKNRATVYRYESNDIENLPLNVLEPLAKVLNTTPAYLMGWEKETSKNINQDDKSTSMINYNLEQYIQSLGFNIIADEAEGNLILATKEAEYEITLSDLESFENTTESFIKFKLSEIMNKSSKFNNKVVKLPNKDDEYTKTLEARRKAEQYFKENPHLMPVASHDKEGEFTEEDYKHDDDIMTNDDLWK